MQHLISLYATCAFVEFKISALSPKYLSNNKENMKHSLEGPPDKGAHESDAQTAASHNQDLYRFPPSLEVLTHHETRGVPRQTHSDTWGEGNHLG